MILDGYPVYPFNTSRIQEKFSADHKAFIECVRAGSSKENFNDSLIIDYCDDYIKETKPCGPNNLMKHINKTWSLEHLYFLGTAIYMTSIAIPTCGFGSKLEDTLTGVRSTLSVLVSPQTAFLGHLFALHG